MPHQPQLPSRLLQAGVQFAERAVAADCSGDFLLAKELYAQAAAAFVGEAQQELNPEQSALLRNKAREYIDRAELLSGLTASLASGTAALSSSAAALPQLEPDTPPPAYSPTPPTYEPAAGPAPAAVTPSAPSAPTWADLEGTGDSLFRAARGHRSDPERAFKLYAEASEAYIRATATTPPDRLQRVRGKAAKALDEAELMKKKFAPTTQASSAAAAAALPDTPFQDPRGPAAASSSASASRSHLSPADSPGSARLPSPTPSPGSPVPKGHALTEREKQILFATSNINHKVYVPWVEADRHERFSGKRFTDPDGLLALSPQQKRHFVGWARPSHLYGDKVCVVKNLSSSCIRQTVVSDCSFVSSLAIGSDFERRFRRKLITKSIFPQDSHGHPIVSPTGKYMIRLHVNGVWRKIIIDDQFPVDASGRLLCSFSNTAGELWISLIEKAYMKVMGGYDFPGSNSGIDLHALSGWIPERLPTKNWLDSDWGRMVNGLRTGDVLVTFATGPLTDAEADRAGLVSTHAYALLDMQEVEGKQLIKLKNPWNHLSWRGKFSPHDDANWTPALERALQYDRQKAKQNDNGEFWIDLVSARHFFEVAYLNWNPDLFVHRFCLHDLWSQETGPVKDTINLEDNPQYRLDLGAHGGARGSLVWVLLSRHIVDIDDFANNKEYITIHVYDSEGRVYYPDNPFKQGIKINSPHYLVKFEPKPGARFYTLVVSQFEKTSTIHFTLRVFSTAPFKMCKLDPFPLTKEIHGNWTPEAAGGSRNLSSNPAFILRIGGKALREKHKRRLVIRLKGYIQYFVGLTLIRGSDPPKDSGPYRPGFCYIELTEVSPGDEWKIIPATYAAGREGKFIISVSSFLPIALTPIGAS